MADNIQCSNTSMDEKHPKHIAIIMDGNGRWAKNQKKNRFSGHKAGVQTVHEITRSCTLKKIPALTLFAFSSENWRRPKYEVNLLMSLFSSALKTDIQTINENNIQLRFIGDRSAFSKSLQKIIAQAEQLTEANTGLTLNIAANYGGRWDIVQATKKIAAAVSDESLRIDDINESVINDYLELHQLPEPDLLIRTGGEKRISNFLLWQLAYTELYFTDTLWPDFNTQCFEHALQWFDDRQRRFGQISEQLEQSQRA